MYTTVGKKVYGTVPIPEPLRSEAKAALAAVPSAKCEWCGGAVKPTVHWSTRTPEGRLSMEAVSFKVSPPMLYGGLFCKMKCALRFAVASHRGGYRRKGTA